ncbi:hypothetical protein D9M69_594550 [compost metagenome]
MPDAIGDFVQRPQLLQIQHRHLEYVVSGAARFQFQHVYQLVDPQAGFLQKLANGGIGCAFTLFKLAAGQRPASSSLAYQQYMPFLLEDDRCAYFH